MKMKSLEHLKENAASGIWQKTMILKYNSQRPEHICLPVQKGFSAAGGEMKLDLR